MDPHVEPGSRVMANSSRDTSRLPVRWSHEQGDWHGLSRQRVLWIDDQVDSSHPVLRFLTRRGFDVEWAGTGLEGLRKAVMEAPDAIILDLRLPDMHGLAVLECLRTRAVGAPVMVVTGFAEIESAVAAIKLGAVDYRAKPLAGDELLQAVRTLVSMTPAKLLPAGDNPGPAHISSATSFDETARRLAAPSVDALEFLVLAQSLRRLSGDSGGAERKRTIRECCSPHQTALASSLVRNIGEALSRGTLPSLDRVAQDAAIPADHVNHILKTFTDLDFRQCRRALRVRPAVPDVALSHEQIAQIAYRHGYQWPGQLDRDFKATLRLTPKAFRRWFLRRVGSGSSGF